MVRFPLVASSEHELGPLSRLYFVFFSLVGLGCLAIRFDALAERIPDPLPALALGAQGPLLLVAGLLESRMPHADGDGVGPLWMQIEDRWVRRGFTLSFTFLSVVLLQTLDVSIGPVDPTPPESFPLPQRAMWFGMFSVGMGFVNYMAAVELFVPPLRAIGRPLRGQNLAWTLPLFGLIGAALSLGLFALFRVEAVREGLAALQAWLDQPQYALALILGPVLVATLKRSASPGRD